MKTMITAALALPLSCLHAQTAVNSFDDIRYWIGSGQNRAALVLQWNDGLSPVSVAWGYRWDGQATGIEMLRAIAGSTQVTDPVGDPVGSGSGADHRLSLGLVDYGWGISVFSLDYSPTGGVTRTRSDWFSGYWEYLIRGGNFEYTDWETENTALYSAAGSSLYESASWISAPVGAAERPLIDGAWDAYSFASGFAPQPVRQPLAAKLPVPVAMCTMHGSTPSISANTVIGLNYRLEYSDSIAGPWHPLGASEPGTGSPIVFADESENLPGQRFYRIAVTQ